ncbi:MAG: hypothetical protein P1U46_00575 [Patescibacteria group bacterium]|nr:hypothetical protein [Patescibacteria group bacterium]
MSHINLLDLKSSQAHRFCKLDFNSKFLSSTYKSVCESSPEEFHLEVDVRILKFQLCSSILY